MLIRLWFGIGVSAWSSMIIARLLCYAGIFPKWQFRKAINSIDCGDFSFKCDVQRLARMCFWINWLKFELNSSLPNLIYLALPFDSAPRSEHHEAIRRTPKWNWMNSKTIRIGITSTLCLRSKFTYNVKPALNQCYDLVIASNARKLSFGCTVRTQKDK